MRGSRLLRVVALLGLIVQLALVAGHVHISGHDDFAANRLCHESTGPSSDQPCPPPSHDKRGETCQFCWAMAGAGIAVPANAAFLATPHLILVAGPHLPQDVRGDITFVAAFDARGPPAIRPI